MGMVMSRELKQDVYDLCKNTPLNQKINVLEFVTLSWIYCNCLLCVCTLPRRNCFCNPSCSLFLTNKL